MRLLGEDITVLAGHGFDEKGPYLLINDISKAAQYRFSVRNRAFTLKQLPERYCVGRFDLLTHQKSEVAAFGAGQHVSCLQRSNGIQPIFLLR